MSLLIRKHAPPKCKPEVLSLEPTRLVNGNTVPCSYQNMGLQIDTSLSTNVRDGTQATSDSLPKDWQAATQLSHGLWL